jgi:HK97 family phage major capsid protein
MASIQEKRASHEKLMRDIAPLTQKMESGELSEAEGKDLDSKASEALALQKDLEQHERLLKMQERGRELGNVPLPTGRGEEKGEDDGSAVAGYMSLGEQFVNSRKYREYIAGGCPEGVAVSNIAAAKDHRAGYAPVTKAQVKGMEMKTVPTIGAGVIEPTRLNDLVRATEFDDLRVLGVLNIGSTDSNSVEWVKGTYTRAAAAVADSASKPEAAYSNELVTSSVRTMAVWMEVTEQQLADAPQVIAEINSNLLYDLEKLKEEEVLYGSGSGQHFTGILNDSAVTAGRSVTGDTVVDKIRRMMTDVRRSGFAPNAGIVDPLDFEDIVLTKGTDDHYLYQVFPTSDGGMRVWGLQLIESNSMTETALASEPERNILVGDFRRGATYWNREAVSLAIGWKNDQFIKNQRTIRAEFRAAFAVRRPLAFRKLTTHAASGTS